jgi:hypothetical protein
VHHCRLVLDVSGARNGDRRRQGLCSASDAGTPGLLARSGLFLRLLAGRRRGSRSAGRRLGAPARAGEGDGAFAMIGVGINGNPPILKPPPGSSF